MAGGGGSQGSGVNTHLQEVLRALPVICKFHIHRFKVIRLLKLWIKFKSYIFFMNLQKTRTV